MAPRRLRCGACAFPELAPAKRHAWPAFNRFLEIARRSSFLGRLRNKAAKFLSLMRESLHLMTRKLALNVKRLFDAFRVNEPLREFEVCLQVRFGVFHGFLVHLACAGREDIGRLQDNVMSLSSGLDKTVVSFTGLIDALAGKVTHGCGNFEI
jgi:hypothetical protein